MAPYGNVQGFIAVRFLGEEINRRKRHWVGVKWSVTIEKFSKAKNFSLVYRLINDTKRTNLFHKFHQRSRFESPFFFG